MTDDPRKRAAILGVQFGTRIFLEGDTPDVEQLPYAPGTPDQLLQRMVQPVSVPTNVPWLRVDDPVLQHRALDAIEQAGTLLTQHGLLVPPRFVVQSRRMGLNTNGLYNIPTETVLINPLMRGLQPEAWQVIMAHLVAQAAQRGITEPPPVEPPAMEVVLHEAAHWLHAQRQLNPLMSIFYVGEVAEQANRDMGMEVYSPAAVWSMDEFVAETFVELLLRPERLTPYAVRYYRGLRGPVVSPPVAA